MQNNANNSTRPDCAFRLPDGIASVYEMRHGDIQVLCGDSGEKLHTKFNIVFADAFKGYFVHTVSGPMGTTHQIEERKIKILRPPFQGIEPPQEPPQEPTRTFTASVYDPENYTHTIKVLHAETGEDLNADHSIHYVDAKAGYIVCRVPEINGNWGGQCKFVLHNLPIELIKE